MKIPLVIFYWALDVFCCFRSGNTIHTGNDPDTQTVNNVSLLSNKNDGFVTTRQKCHLTTYKLAKCVTTISTKTEKEIGGVQPTYWLSAATAQWQHLHCLLSIPLKDQQLTQHSQGNTLLEHSEWERVPSVLQPKGDTKHRGSADTGEGFGRDRLHACPQRCPQGPPQRRAEMGTSPEPASGDAAGRERSLRAQTWPRKTVTAACRARPMEHEGRLPEARNAQELNTFHIWFFRMLLESWEGNVCADVNYSTEILKLPLLGEATMTPREPIFLISPVCHHTRVAVQLCDCQLWS